MGKSIPAEYADDAHYWEKYPGLFEGAYSIRIEILNHEINKYSLCDNSYAFKKYNWKPQVSMEEGLKRLIEAEVKFLKEYDGHK